jgi:hypothetical protein
MKKIFLPSRDQVAGGRDGRPPEEGGVGAADGTSSVAVGVNQGHARGQARTVRVPREEDGAAIGRPGRIRAPITPGEPPPSGTVGVDHDNLEVPFASVVSGESDLLAIWRPDRPEAVVGPLSCHRQNLGLRSRSSLRGVGARAGVDNVRASESEATPIRWPHPHVAFPAGREALHRSGRTARGAEASMFRGRKTGRTYHTPVNVFRRGDAYFFFLTHG